MEWSIRTKWQIPFRNWKATFKGGNNFTCFPFENEFPRLSGLGLAISFNIHWFSFSVFSYFALYIRPPTCQPWKPRRLNNRCLLPPRRKKQLQREREHKYPQPKWDLLDTYSIITFVSDPNHEMTPWSFWVFCLMGIGLNQPFESLVLPIIMFSPENPTRNKTNLYVWRTILPNNLSIMSDSLVSFLHHN